MEKNNGNSSNGIGFVGVLAIVFIVLKLCKVIDWSWLWVLAPIWIPFVLATLFGIIYIVVDATIKHKQYKATMKKIKAEVDRRKADMTNEKYFTKK